MKVIKKNQIVWALLTSLCLHVNSVYAIELISVQGDGSGGAEVPLADLMTSVVPPDISYAGQFSSDGRAVVFVSTSKKLTSPPVPSPYDNVGLIYLHDRDKKETILISKPNPGIDYDNNGDNDIVPDDQGYSYWPSISNDGKRIAFQSQAGNLIKDYDLIYSQSHKRTEIYYYDKDTDRIKLVTDIAPYSPGYNNGQDQSERPAISGDGRYIAFESRRHNIDNNFAPAWHQNISHVYVYDVDAETNSVISRASGTSGDVGNDDSFIASISGDGRYIVFKSEADNLITNEADINYGVDLFLRDTQANTTELISKSASTGSYTTDGGSFTNKGSIFADDIPGSAISDDGNFIVYHSDSTELVAGDISDGVSDIFLYDRANNKTIKITKAHDGNVADGHSDNPSISPNGRYIAFRSEANNLVDDDSNTGEHMPTLLSTDIFVYDRVTETIEMVDRAANAAPAEPGSFAFQTTSVNDNGEVLFSTTARNLMQDKYSRPFVGGIDLYVSGFVRANPNNISSIPSTNLPILAVLTALLSLLAWRKKMKV